MTFDIKAPDSDTNLYAYQQIRHRVEQCGERQNLQTGHEVLEPVRKRKEKTSKARKHHGKRRRVDDARHRGKSIELMACACSVAMYLTQRWIMYIVIVLLCVDFVSELHVTWDHVSKAGNWVDGSTTCTAVILLLLSIPCRFVAGIVSMRCLEGFAHTIKNLGLKVVLRQHDINSIKDYLLKEGILRQPSRYVKETEVVEALQTYLGSTDNLFLVFPWVHSGVLVLMSICGPFRDEFWHRQPDSPDSSTYIISVQLLSRLVDVLATFVLLGFCHSAASCYQIQNKLLVDIHHVFTSSDSQTNVPPSKDIIIAWNKLRNEIENSATRALTAGIIGVMLQVLVLAGVAMAETPGVLEVTRLHYVIHIWLLLSEGIANCPSRSMKGIGLVLDGILLLLFLVKTISGYSETVHFGYGSVRLMEFRLLSYKLFYVLCLHTRLIRVSRNWQYQTHTVTTVDSRVLNCVIAFWVVAFVFDCFPIAPLIRHFVQVIRP